MSKSVLVSVGVVLILLGLVWALQGFGVLGGSAMSGVALWAVVGPLVVILGAAVVTYGLRRRP